MKLEELFEATKFNVGDKVIFKPKNPHDYDFGSKSLDDSPISMKGEVTHVYSHGKHVDIKVASGSLNVNVGDLSLDK